MDLSNRKLTGREKDKAAVELLEKLREKLYADTSSVARRAAFNLSWMQEDGFEILEEALLNRTSRRTKSAACYGFRNMHGRMKKKAEQLLQKASQASDPKIREVCQKAIRLMERPRDKKGKNRRRGRIQIKEMRDKGKRRSISHTSPLSNPQRNPRRR